MAFLAVVLSAFVIVVGVPITGLILLARFLAAEHEPREVSSSFTAPSVLSGPVVWAHLKGWYRAKPRRLTFRGAR